MGVSVKAQENTESEYVTSVKSMCKIIMNRTFNPLKTYDFSYQFTNDSKIEKRALNVLHSYTDSVINKRVDELRRKQRGETVNTESDVGVRRKKAFLDLLLEATIDGQPLSKADIREEVDTFMFEVIFPKNNS